MSHTKRNAISRQIVYTMHTLIIFSSILQWFQSSSFVQRIWCKHGMTLTIVHTIRRSVGRSAALETNSRNERRLNASNKHAALCRWCKSTAQQQQRHHLAGWLQRLQLLPDRISQTSSLLERAALICLQTAAPLAQCSAVLSLFCYTTFIGQHCSERRQMEWDRYTLPPGTWSRHIAIIHTLSRWLLFLYQCLKFFVFTRFARLSHGLGVCPSVTLCSPIKTVQARITKSSQRT